MGEIMPCSAIKVQGMLLLTPYKDVKTWFSLQEAPRAPQTGKVRQDFESRAKKPVHSHMLDWQHSPARSKLFSPPWQFIRSKSCLHTAHGLLQLLLGGSV